MASGRNLIDIASRHLGERYVYGARVAKDNADHRGPWDCAEFISWCVYQEVRQLYGCNNNQSAPSRADAYTGYWERDARNVLEMISVGAASGIAGAIVLRYPTSRNGHIAFSDGQGTTVEAMDRRHGVTRGTIAGRSWHTGILLPDVDYGARGTPINYQEPDDVLRVGGPGADPESVKDLQRTLAQLGYDPGPVDGIYGPMTAIAAYNFQADRGLVADGEVGPLTRKALEDAREDRDLEDSLNASTARGEFTIDSNLKKTASSLTAERIDAFFGRQEDDKQHLRGIGPAVMQAAVKYTINSAYIVAHAILETGWGRSRIYREKNNLFGWGAEDTDPYRGAKRFESREECIDFVMGRVDALYLQSSGRYFETSPCLGNKRYGMNVHYASDPTWGSDIARIARRLEREA